MNKDLPSDPVARATAAATPQTAAAASPPPKPPAETPGGLIRTARELLQMSIEELAAQTKLPRMTLDALERDDFAALLEPVYVRGYYRKCAKVLNLPEADVLKAYERRVVPRTQLPPAKLRLGTGADMGGGRRFGSVLVVAVLAVLAGIVIWYLRGERAPRTEASLPAQSAVTGDATSAPSSVAEAPSTIPSAPVSEAPTALPATPSVTPAAPPLPASTVPAPGAGAATVATGSQLQLNFVSISWARAQDANGRVLLNRVVQAGERQVLDGLPPYTVFLGNAAGVRVTYRGASVDIRPMTRDNATARFTVPLATP